MGRHHYEIIAGRYVLRAPYRRAGVWVCDYRDLVTGKVHKKSSGIRRSKFDARHVIVQYLQTLASNEGQARIALEAALEEWVELKDVRLVTRSDYASMARNLSRLLGGQVLVGDLRVQDVEEMLYRMRRDGLSARTRSKYLWALKDFLTWSERRGYCRKNVALAVRVGKGTKREPRPLSVDEARSLLQASSGYLHRAIALALYTGLRHRNVFEMRWRHVDLRQRRISFDPHEMKGGLRHEVPIHQDLVGLLTSELQMQGVNAEGLVVGVANAKKAFASALRDAGLEGSIWWHDLRHTFATWLEPRTTASALRTLLSHSGGPVTARYTHTTWTDLVDAIHSLPKLLDQDQDDVRKRQ